MALLFECHKPQGASSTVLDIVLLAVGLGFFALSVAYAHGCDRL